MLTWLKNKFKKEKDPDPEPASLESLTQEEIDSLPEDKKEIFEMLDSCDTFFSMYFLPAGKDGESKVMYLYDSIETLKSIFILITNGYFENMIIDYCAENVGEENGIDPDFFNERLDQYFSKKTKDMLVNPIETEENNMFFPPSLVFQRGGTEQ